MTMPKVEDIQAASLKKSEEIDSQLQKALSARSELRERPGFGPPPAGAGTPAGRHGAVPNQGGAVLRRSDVVHRQA